MLIKMKTTIKHLTLWLITIAYCILVGSCKKEHPEHPEIKQANENHSEIKFDRIDVFPLILKLIPVRGDLLAMQSEMKAYRNAYFTTGNEAIRLRYNNMVDKQSKLFSEWKALTKQIKEAEDLNKLVR